MNHVKDIVEKYIRHLPLLERVYSTELPNPSAIAKELGSDGVAMLFEEIAKLSAEREILDKEGKTNGDELDDYWRAIVQLASIIPYQIRLYPKQAINGLLHDNSGVRFYVAYSLSQTPIRQALPQLESALLREQSQFVAKVFQLAIVACSSFSLCTREKIAKIVKSPIVWKMG